MKIIRRFDNTNNILEINERTKTTLKSTRYYLNQKGCYDKISSYTYDLTSDYCKRYNTCIKQQKALEDWNTAVVQGLI
tara:strand:- start:55 stop:288 length:234 start_codon:yes stop_codon:yes gene_type:complete